ncbi:hypothetical protein V5J35_004027 [Endozoicomonas sp. NE40]|uniref:Uncharacterized protein n=1 Tax=Endozoicomonas lisbonensis TaxID=3120522 RepID=A0ABV2SM43_9GAMM
MKLFPSVSFYFFSLLPLVSTASILTDECIALIQESREEICRLSSGEEYKNDKVFSTFQPHWSTDKITVQRYNTVPGVRLEHTMYEKKNNFSMKLCDLGSSGCVLAFYLNQAVRSDWPQVVSYAQTTPDSRLNGTLADNFTHRKCLNVNCSEVKVPGPGPGRASESKTFVPRLVTICCLCSDPLQKPDVKKNSNKVLDEGFENIDVTIVPSAGSNQ